MKIALFFVLVNIGVITGQSISGEQDSKAERKLSIEEADSFSGLKDTGKNQEILYQGLLTALKSQDSVDIKDPPGDKFDLLKLNQENYSDASLIEDEIIIPYPRRKVKELSEIRYKIPADFFIAQKPASQLEPQIRLSFNSSQSTISINNSYPLTFYRSPGVPDITLETSRQAMIIIYNMILPCASRFEYGTNIKQGTILFKAYTPHELNLANDAQWNRFWHYLRREGSLYFYPSKIDNLEQHLMVYGLLYVLNNERKSYYHFGELTFIMSKDKFPEENELKLIFFSYIKNIDEEN